MLSLFLFSLRNFDFPKQKESAYSNIYVDNRGLFQRERTRKLQVYIYYQEHRQHFVLGIFTGRPLTPIPWLLL